MPKMIVVPLDGSTFAERALGPAGEVARRAAAHVVVMTERSHGVVIEPKRYLEEAARAAGIEDPELVVVEGRSVASAIASVTGESPDTVVVMTTHARVRFGQALFGSVAEEVLRGDTNPALLVGPSVPEALTILTELVACLDGSERANAILPFAAVLARDLQVELVLLRVAEPDSESSAEEPTSVVRALGDLQRIASDLEATCGSVRCEVLAHGRPAEAIVEFAHDHPGAILALTTHGRSGFARVTAGSVAMAVVRDARCPVLVARPDDFDSPG